MVRNEQKASMSDSISPGGPADADIRLLKKERVYRNAWTIELTSGEKVWVDRLDVERTYLGWIDGVPDRAATDREVAAALAFVRAHFHGPEPVLLPPVLFDPDSDAPILQPLRFAAQVRSCSGVDGSEGSWMNLVWFAEIDDEKSIKAFVEEALARVDWKRQAEGFES